MSTTPMTAPTTTTPTPASVPGPAPAPIAAGVTGPAVPGVRSWPLLLLALPAFVAIWAGWVGLGTLTGFGRVQPLPGTPLADWTLDTRITLPIGVETYAAYALRVWLSGRATGAAGRFAKWSAIGSLVLGAAGQVAYHLMEAAKVTAAPWWITAVVACLPVAVLGMGAALAHLTAAAVLTAPVGPVVVDAGVDEVEKATGRPVADQQEAGGVGGVDHQGNHEQDARADEPARQNQPKIPDHQGNGTRVRPGRGSSARSTSVSTTADRVARLRQRHPDMPTADIARRLGVTDRTVRRHLAASTATTATATPAPGAVTASRAA